MDAWNKFTNKVSDVGNQISGKAKKSIEQQKVESKLEELRKSVNEEYFALGKIAYEQYKKNENAIPEVFKSSFFKIKNLKSQIEENENTIKQMNSQITCPNCGEIIPAETNFCPFCGTKIEHRRGGFCRKCGAPLEPDAKFCVMCGTPVVSDNVEMVNKGKTSQTEVENSSDNVKTTDSDAKEE